MYEDLNLKFQSKKKELELLFCHLEELGIDTQSYQEGLKKIEQDWEQGQEKSYGPFDSLFLQSSYAQASNVSNSAKYIKKLLSIYQDLTLIFNEYIKIFYSCRTLEDTLADERLFGIAEVNNMANEVITNLKRLSQPSNIGWDMKKDLVDRVIDVAYKVMKLEMLVKNDSLVFNFISKQFDAAIPFMVDRIRLDISPLNNEQNIQMYLDQVYSDDIVHGLFNQDLIKELSKCFYSKEQLDAIESRFEELGPKYVTIEEEQKNLLETQEYYEGTKRGTIRSLIISAAIIAGMVFGKTYVIDKHCRQRVYLTEKTTYTQDAGFIRQPITFEEKQPKVVANVYHPWEKFDHKYIQIIDTYDLSSITYDDLISYTEMDLSTLDGTRRLKEERDVTKTDANPQSYTEFIFTQQDETISKPVDTNLSNALTALLFIIGGVLEVFSLSLVAYFLIELTKCNIKDETTLRKIKQNAEMLKSMEEEYETLKNLVQNCQSNKVKKLGQ